MAEASKIIWIVNLYDNLPTEGNRSQRYWLMARTFVCAGHKVIYWTSDFSHGTKHKRVMSRKVDDGFAVRQIDTMPYVKNICLARILSHKRLAEDWLYLAKMDASKPDVIIASTPPLGLCGTALAYAKSIGAMFIADVQDAWPETFERVLPKWMLLLFGLYSKAKRIYRDADAISAVAMRYVELAQKYGSDVPMMVFGHCIDMTTKVIRAAMDATTLRIAYIGNMSLSYDLETVIKAVSSMDGVSLDIAGNGPCKERLEGLSKDAANIKFHGYLGDADLSKLLASCNVGLIPMFPESCVGVPGKLADYAAAGVKIIESLGGETARLIDKYGVGSHYNAGDVESLRQAITAIRNSVTTPNPPEFVAQFDAATVMNDYVKWVRDLCRCRQDWGSTRGPHSDPFVRG